MKTICICSGGMDSSCMAGIHKNDELLLMSFQYGQKGKKEIESVKILSEKLGCEFKVIDIGFMQEIYGDSNQLTSDKINIENNYKKSVVVPFRNGVFLTIAIAYGIANGFEKVIMGSHLNDMTDVNHQRMYPDCSVEFFKSFELAVEMGNLRETPIKIESASTMGLEKKDLILFGFENLGELIYNTWSCYYSMDKHCGECESCQNRKNAFKLSGIEDKTEYLK